MPRPRQQAPWQLPPSSEGVTVEANDSAVYLVSCVRKKRTATCLARELYVSDWFLKASRYVEASGCDWFILSAEYGLVAPDQVIAPYERTLKRMHVEQRKAWAHRVSEQLAEAAPKLSHVVLLAGERYREFLVPCLSHRGVVISVPMERLRIGEQLRWLGQHSPQRSQRS